MTIEDPLVLVVEDDNHLADMYAEWLEETYAVRTAYDGDQALDALDGAVDVVLLDRLMPGLSGDTVLDTIRTRDLDCRVAMVTAVEPDFDIVEMGFDEYLVKPVYRGDLYQTIESLLTRASYVEQFREYHALANKRVTLEAEKPKPNSTRATSSPRSPHVWRHSASVSTAWNRSGPPRMTSGTYSVVSPTEFPLWTTMNGEVAACARRSARRGD